jgi:chromosome segregation ATPase
MNQIETLKEYVESDKQSLLIEVSALKKSLNKANKDIKNKDKIFNELNSKYEDQIKEIELDLKTKLENQYKSNTDSKNELDLTRKSINQIELETNQYKTKYKDKCDEFDNLKDELSTLNKQVKCVTDLTNK